jgi:hypothetical protein
MVNPATGLNNADVVRLRNAAAILLQVIPVWDQLPNYAGQVTNLADTAFNVQQLATQIEGYLAVEGL